MRATILRGCGRRAKKAPDTDQLPKFSVTRRVKFSPEQIYAVVADVASYKDFLPLIERSTVRGRKPTMDGIEKFSADLVVAYYPLRIQEEFLSQVEADANKRLVTTVSTGAAVKKLYGSWQIEGLGPNSSDIHFSVDYEMKSMMLQMLMSGMFDSAVRKIMNAFESRAEKLYRT
jgi:coenzyme Q-binding protein COQ10